ncbi:hypothetical protein EDB83DRAFT_559725 [Lactarius deliciosus]|nr:hypothetical protein EDB83DRAFT_559725 [Lactarius deliciosus]
MNLGAARRTMCTNYVLLIPLVAFGTHSESLTTTQINSLVKPSSWWVIFQDGKVIVTSSFERFKNCSSERNSDAMGTMHHGAMSQPRERRVKSISTITSIYNP